MRRIRISSGRSSPASHSRDALILDGRGNVVYSAYKERRSGHNIPLTGPYSSSKLRDAYQEAMSSNKADPGGVHPTEFYEPANMAPHRLDKCAPIPPTGKAEGVLALQFPITKIGSLTFDKKWAEVGMGETGETILAGSDFLMRSDSRLFWRIRIRVPTESHRRRHPTRHPGHRDPPGRHHAVPASESPGQAGLFRLLITGLSRQGRPSRPTRADGRSPTANCRWCKIDTKEAFARESLTRISSLRLSALSSLAQVFPAPIRRLEAGVQRLPQGDYQIDVPVETASEIGGGMFSGYDRSLAVRDLVKISSATDPPPAELAHAGGMSPTRSATGRSPREHSNVSVIYAEIGGFGPPGPLNTDESLNISAN